MKREFKPGDVAILMTEGGERIGFRCGVRGNVGWQYAREPGQNTWSSDGSGYVTPLRPLAVIDPEDREQVERLHRAVFRFGGMPVDRAALTYDTTQAALREFANPTPPKPAEPLDPAARVIDRDGLAWARWRGDWQPLGSGKFAPLTWDSLVDRRSPLEVTA